MKKLLVGSTGLVLCLLSNFSYADESWERSFHWSWGPGAVGVGMSCFMIPMILMIAFWVAVIVGLVYFVKWVISLTSKEPEIKTEEPALEILKKRYAKGEISREVFERMKQDIQ